MVREGILGSPSFSSCLLLMILPSAPLFSLSIGKDWEKTWSDYVKNWKSPCRETNIPDKECFQSSKRIKAMNHDKFNDDYYVWSDSHVSTCHYNETLIEEYGEVHYIVQQRPIDFGHVVDPSIKLEYEGIKFSHKGFDLPRCSIEGVGYKGVACKILSSSIESDRFDVIYFLGDTDELEGARTIWRLREIPSSYVMFHHRPFQSDMMRSGAFRSEIAFPDDAFPRLWKDIESQ